MASFMITSLAVENPALASKVKEMYEGNSITIAPNCWLVSGKGVTTQEVCNKLTITVPEDGPGKVGRVVAVRIENYFGFAPAHIWEWLKAKGVTE